MSAAVKGERFAIQSVQAVGIRSLESGYVEGVGWREEVVYHNSQHNRKGLEQIESLPG